MRLRRLIPLTFVLALAIWSVATWPLPRQVRTAIPCSSLNPHHHPARHMIPGDHLQLLYRFWLFGDILKGHSPWGTNVYEFNRNNDPARRQPGAYYLPFSLIYAVGAEWLGMPFGWNLAGFVSLWLTFLFTALVVRFYTRDPWQWLAFGALSILFPYRYAALLGGSPTGYAMMWPPLVVLGLEWALRKNRAAGGFLAGLGLFLTCISDLQLFFFTVLLALAWSATLFLACWRNQRPPLATAIVRGLRTLWPVAAALVAAYAYSRHLAHFVSGSAHMASGRSMREVALYSPRLADLFSLDLAANAHGAYLGYAWMLLAIGAVLFHVRSAIIRKSGRDLALTAAWGGALWLVCALALGANGPGNGALYALARRLLPPLQMIRQPARFLTLAPTLIPVLLGMVTAPLFLQLKPRTGRIVLGVFAAAMAFEYARFTQVELCLLDPQQGAYAAVQRDHASRSATPARALALPLWPGDSHWSSLYQYYASLYRIRMLNGYAPVVEQEYQAEVFERFRSLNAGVIGNDQLDALLAMDIHHVLLHEDAFPEIVSPFPIARTLDRLSRHPRLELIERDARVWAFRILEKPQAPAAHPALPCPIQYPARRYYPERQARNAAARVENATAGRGRAVRLNPSFPSIYVAFTSLVGEDGVYWLMRARGQGRLAVRTQGGDRDWQSQDHAVESDEWTWLAVPAASQPDYSTGHVFIQWVAGEMEIDYVCLTTAGTPLEAMTLAPACFFRAGQADPGSGSVLFEPGRDAMGRVFYGPRLPFVAGHYRVELHYESEAPAGAFLGTWVLEKPESATARSVEVRAGGTPAVLDLELSDGVPVVFSFDFAAEHPIRLVSVRVDPAAGSTLHPEGVNREGL